MKEFIVSFGIVMAFTLALFYQNDYNIHQEEIHRLKFVSEEVAAAAAQFFDRERYGDGYYVFNAQEGIRGAEHVLEQGLYLNEDLSPKPYAYWRQAEKIEYTVDLVSSINTKRVVNGNISTDINESHVFPKTYNFTHFGKTKSVVLFGPSVIVTVKTGKPRYRLVADSLLVDNHRTAIHTWEE